VVDRGSCRTLGGAAALLAGLLLSACSALRATESAAGFARPVWEPPAVDGTDLLAAPSSGAPPARGAMPTSGAGALGAWSTDPMPVSLRQDREQADEDARGHRHVTAMLGVNLLDDDWDPVDDQFVLGFEFDNTDPEHGHGFEVGLQLAGDEDEQGANDIYSATTQIYGGWRKTFRPQPEADVHPFVAAGLAILWTAYEIDTPVGDIDDDDVEPGAYIRVGVLFDLGARMRCGVDYRHVFADDFDLSGVDYEGDFDQVVLTFGFAF
jgi:hypothetical protein